MYPTQQSEANRVDASAPQPANRSISPNRSGQRHFFAGTPLPAWLNDLPDTMLRAWERRQLREALTPCSDRVLADTGFSRENLPEEIDAVVAEFQRWREIKRQVRRELASYSDRELDDIGISRVDIPRIAREHPRPVLDLNRLGIMDAGEVLRAIANDNGGRRHRHRAPESAA
ncbi:DUF1127 domain-containing protein [Pelagibius litoralis]|uniref:DUF1127 domain-containing protein n=1 Tax=Pelagibius litoralis TaxID=374515 RepID=A0A967EY86_9PROT|nr:DUF1127 domain-containing protein [Pelagibius litoralis]NIA69637.1 DUF1127 domain-containing protein [Pelagibius litoralis]